MASTLSGSRSSSSWARRIYQLAVMSCSSRSAHARALESASSSVFSRTCAREARVATHGARCTWRDAHGVMRMARCAWRAVGAMHVERCSRCALDVVWAHRARGACDRGPTAFGAPSLPPSRSQARRSSRCA